MTIPAFSTGAGAGKQNRLSRCSLWAVWLIALATPAFAQSFHFGVKAGVPVTQYFQSGRLLNERSFTAYTAATRRYTGGLSAELRLRSGLGFEVDALYKRMGYVATVDNFRPPPPATFIQSAYDVKGHSWDFPMMAKYRFGGPAHPYVAGGATLRYIGPVRARGASRVHRVSVGVLTTPIDTAPELQDRVFAGVTVAGGLEFGFGRLRLLPEIRYTHWTTNISRAGGLLRFEPNQAEFLLGLLF